MDKLYTIRTEINKFVNTYNKLEKIPFEVGDGEVLYPSEMNMIEAIGKGMGNTVTQLCLFFGVTKGAVSQTISKLNSRSYVKRERNEAYSKEIILSLTERGKEIFDMHEQFHQTMDHSMEQLILKIPPDNLKAFLEILNLASQHLESYLDLSTKKL